MLLPFPPPQAKSVSAILYGLVLDNNNGQSESVYMYESDIYTAFGHICKFIITFCVVFYVDLGGRLYLCRVKMHIDRYVHSIYSYAWHRKERGFD